MTKRYQRCNQNLYIEEGQTTQWPKDTKGVIRICILKKNLLQYTDSDYPFGICWPLCCLFFFNIQILITPLVSFGHCVVCSSTDNTMANRYQRGNQNQYIEGQTTQWPKDTKGVIRICIRFWLLLWYLLVIVLSVLLQYTDSDYLFGIFWSLCCLFFFNIQILITSLVSFGHWVIRICILKKNRQHNDQKIPKR
jgi:hypothetical protein